MKEFSGMNRTEIHGGGFYSEKVSQEASEWFANVYSEAVERYRSLYFGSGLVDPLVFGRDCLRTAMAAIDVLESRKNEFYVTRGRAVRLVAGSAQYCRIEGDSEELDQHWSYQYTEVEAGKFGELVTATIGSHLPEIHCWVEIENLCRVDMSAGCLPLVSAQCGFEWTCAKSRAVVVSASQSELMKRWVAVRPNWQATLLARTIESLIRAENLKTYRARYGSR